MHNYYYHFCKYVAARINYSSALFKFATAVADTIIMQGFLVIFRQTIRESQQTQSHDIPLEVATMDPQQIT